MDGNIYIFYVTLSGVLMTHPSTDVRLMQKYIKEETMRYSQTILAIGSEKNREEA